MARNMGNTLALTYLAKRLRIWIIERGCCIWGKQTSWSEIWSPSLQPSEAVSSCIGGGAALGLGAPFISFIYIPNSLTLLDSSLPYNISKRVTSCGFKNENCTLSTLRHLGIIELEQDGPYEEVFRRGIARGKIKRSVRDPHFSQDGAPWIQPTAVQLLREL